MSNGKEATAENLAKILLIQNMAGQMADERSILDFVCQGLIDLPGVARAWHENEAAERPANVSAFALQINRRYNGDILLEISDPAQFDPYECHMQNLVFMLAVILEERRQRELNAQHQRELEQRVRERTSQLSRQVSETVAAEAKALLEKARAELYLEVSRAIVVELSRSGTVDMVNQRGCEVLGLSQDEIRGQDWFGLTVPPAKREAARAMFNEIMHGDTEFVEDFENRILTADGESRCIAWHNLAIRHDDGSIVGVLSSGIDITDRKEAEVALADESHRLAVTLRSIGDGVIAIDTEGRIGTMNRVAENLTGMSIDQALGQPFQAVFQAFDELTGEPCDDPVRQVLETGQRVEVVSHTLLRSHLGSQFNIAFNGAPIRDRTGTSIGVVLVVSDITEKQRLLLAAQRTEKLDSLGILAGGIAHDFNNLLGGLFGYLDLALAAADTNSETAECLHTAMSILERTKNLTEQLLTFAKGSDPQRQPCAISSLIEDSVSFALSGSNVAADFRFASDLWMCDLDKNQIGQVFDNMAINAQQSMSLGGVFTVSADNVEIDQKSEFAYTAGRYVRISLRDTGDGIPREILARIFDPFFSTKERGSGLGLATCHSIVEQHDGWIEVESDPGIGSIFRIYLPASQVEHLDSAVSSRDFSHEGDGTLLVLEDDESLQRVIKRFLVSMGYEVVVANTGQEILEQYRDAMDHGRSFVGAILDLTIPGGMGGQETVAGLRSLASDIPIIAASGYSEDPVIARPTEFGFNGSIAKPFTKKDLAAVLNEHFKI